MSEILERFNCKPCEEFLIDLMVFHARRKIYAIFRREVLSKLRRGDLLAFINQLQTQNYQRLSNSKTIWQPNLEELKSFIEAETKQNNAIFQETLLPAVV